MIVVIKAVPIKEGGGALVDPAKFILLYGAVHVKAGASLDVI